MREGRRERERERERGADFESGVRISSENARLLRARCCSDPKFDFDRLVVLLAFKLRTGTELK